LEDNSQTLCSRSSSGKHSEQKKCKHLISRDDIHAKLKRIKIVTHISSMESVAKQAQVKNINRASCRESAKGKQTQNCRNSPIKSVASNRWKTRTVRKLGGDIETPNLTSNFKRLPPTVRCDGSQCSGAKRHQHGQGVA